MEGYGSRKFIIALLALGLNAYLVYAGHIADGVYSAVTISVVAGYFAANVGQKVTAKA